MRLTWKEIEEEIGRLGDHLVPRMLQSTGNVKAWVEFLERANVIKARVPPDQRDLVRVKVCELLSVHNLVLASQKASSNRATTARIYAFPSGIRMS
ncbi:hypothetical protein ISN76_04635 [Dyella halodurans]|uniref:Uncharacterized protein n=1 Tax=Dyella halodurans TaxID=1920171 RepID=A0ABV9C213_9GAMM|nr:hypothetical protein [Dyella halodurans]